MTGLGQIIVLNGAPRSGKSSIAAAIQSSFDGVWVNLGIDSQIAGLADRFRPGAGLRPGGERPDIETLAPVLYAALYESMASYCRLGLNVVADVGHHDFYSRPMNMLPDCARRLRGVPALLVGVRCAIETIMQRRDQAAAGPDAPYLTTEPNGAIPEPVLLWQREVHKPGIYDLEVDTSRHSAQECASLIKSRLENGGAPTAFEILAGLRMGGLA